VATAREAFRRRGIPNFDRHILVASSPDFGNLRLSTILVKRSPFTTSEIQSFFRTVDFIPHSRVLYARGQPLDRDPVGEIISLPEESLRNWYGSNRYNLSPVTDDIPFFWHFVRFRDSVTSRSKRNGWVEGIGEKLILALFVFALAFAAVFLALPLLTVRETWSALPHKAKASIYFAALGMGFMFFEISLIQKLTLFLGYPTYSLSVTLFALLCFTGLGSLASDRYAGSRRRALFGLLGGIALIVLFYRMGLPGLIDRFAGSPLPLRIALAVLAIAPLGICLGAFMPIGLKTVAALSEQREVYIAWGWALNSYFSVAGSALSTIPAMSVGFNTVLLIALMVYLIGVASLLRIPSVEVGPA